MVSVSANNALLPGSVVTKKAMIVIIITTFLFLGLAVDAQAVSVLGAIADIRDILPTLLPSSNSSAEVGPAASIVSSTTNCLSEGIACVSDEDCFNCMEQLDDDDDSDCEGAYYGCDGLWDGMCCAFAQGSAACTDNEALFDVVRECLSCGRAPLSLLKGNRAMCTNKYVSGISKSSRILYSYSSTNT